MRKLILITCLTIFCAQSFAWKESGGGDVNAVEFIRAANTIAQWLKFGQSEISKEDVARVESSLSVVVRQMDGGSRPPITFENVDLLRDSFGAEKMAIFTTEPNSIRVSRQSWNRLTTQQRYELVALELFGMSGIADRYAVAAIVQREFQSIVRGSVDDLIYRNQLTWAFSKTINESIGKRYDGFGYNGLSREVQDIVYVSGFAMQQMERKMAVQVFEGAESFLKLPAQFLFDTYALGAAYVKYDILIPSTGSWGAEAISRFPLSFVVGRRTVSYILQMKEAAETFEKRYGSNLKPESKKLMDQIRKKQIKIDKLLKVYPDSDMPKPVFYKHIENLETILRQKVLAKNCNVGASFPFTNVFDTKIIESVGKPTSDQIVTRDEANDQLTELTSLMAWNSLAWEEMKKLEPKHGRFLRDLSDVKAAYSVWEFVQSKIYFSERDMLTYFIAQVDAGGLCSLAEPKK